MHPQQQLHRRSPCPAIPAGGGVGAPTSLLSHRAAGSDTHRQALYPSVPVLTSTDWSGWLRRPPWDQLRQAPPVARALSPPQAAGSAIPCAHTHTRPVANTALAAPPRPPAEQRGTAPAVDAGRRQREKEGLEGTAQSQAAEPWGQGAVTCSHHYPGAEGVPASGLCFLHVLPYRASYCSF